MNLVEAYNLFMLGLNPQLHQLAVMLVDYGDLNQVIEVGKRVMVYGEDKNSASSNKNENQNKKG